MDAKSIAATNKVFGEIDNINNNFYSQIKLKKIEIKSLIDIERVEILFEKSLKELMKLIDDLDSYEPQIKQIIRARLIIDFHGRFSESFGLDLMSVVERLSAYNKQQFAWALENIEG
jgi:hypothetical protein